MNIFDYKKGTAYLRLCRSDYRDPYRFDAYARFIGQEGDDVVIVPIDHDRAILESHPRREPPEEVQDDE